MTEKDDLANQVVSSILKQTKKEQEKPTPSQNMRLQPISSTYSYKTNLLNISNNFRLLHNRVKIIDEKNANVNALLRYNKKLIESTMSILNKAIIENRKNEFNAIENKLELSDIKQLIDDRVYKILAKNGLYRGNGYYRNGYGVDPIAAGVIGAGGALSALAAKTGISALTGTAATALKGLGIFKAATAATLIAGIPLAVENPNNNMYTSIGTMLDGLKSLMDPTYKGHEARDIVRVFTNSMSKFSKEIDAKKEKQRQEDAKKRAEEDAKFLQEQQKIMDAYLEKQTKDTEEKMKQPDFFMHGDTLDAYRMLQKANAKRLDKAQMNLWYGHGTPEEVEKVKQENQVRIDMFMGYVFKTTKIPTAPHNGFRRKKIDMRLQNDPSLKYLPTPDEFKIPGQQYPLQELKTPDDFKVDKTSSINYVTERIHVASLGSGYEYLKSLQSSDQSRLEDVVNASKADIAKDFSEDFSNYNLKADAINIRARMLSYNLFGAFSVEAFSDLSLKSKRAIIIEAPEITLRGVLKYEGLTLGNYAGSSAPIAPNKVNSGGFVSPGSSFGGGFSSWMNSGQAASAGITQLGGTLGSSDSSNVAISDRASWAYQYLKSKGWTDAQAAGIVGNLMAESGTSLNPNSQGDGGRAYGIAQWHPDRQSKFTSVFGKDIRNSTFEEQMAFVDWELNNSEKRAGSMLRSATDAASAAAIVDQHYERSSGVHRAKRMNYAIGIMGSSTSASTTTPKVPTNTSFLSMLGENSSKLDSVSNSGSGINPLDVAKKYQGLDERNPQDIKTLQKLFKDQAGLDLSPDTAAWCAAFMNGVLGESGVDGTGKATARSFLNYGTPVEDPQVGDIVVFDRGGGWKGHVGFITGIEERDGKTFLKVLGGNQSTDESQGRGVTVNIKEFSTDKVLGYRRPPGATPASKIKQADDQKSKKPVETANTGNTLMSSNSAPSSSTTTPAIVNNTTVVAPTSETKVAKNSHDGINMSSFAMLDLFSNIA